MGEFAFAKSFRMLQDEQWHIAVIMLRKAMRLLGPLSPLPWLAQIGFYIMPWMYVVRDWLAMLVWCPDRMTERIKVLLTFDVVKLLLNCARFMSTSQTFRIGLSTPPKRQKHLDRIETGSVKIR
jgi:hypothetical protein